MLDGRIDTVTNAEKLDEAPSDILDSVEEKEAGEVLTPPEVEEVDETTEAKHFMQDEEISAGSVPVKVRLRRVSLVETLIVGRTRSTRHTLPRAAGGSGARWSACSASRRRHVRLSAWSMAVRSRLTSTP